MQCRDEKQDEKESVVKGVPGVLECGEECSRPR